MKNVNQCMIETFAGLFLLFVSCTNGNNKADAYGNFESEAIIVSAQNTGELLRFDIEEGITLKKNEPVGIIDTTSLVLQIKQLLAQKKVLAAKNDQIKAQIKVQTEQLKNLEREKNRFEKLYSNQAATQQQYQDMEGNVNVAESQLQSIKSQFLSVEAEAKVLEAQLNVAQNQLLKCNIINPEKGTVLEKYVNNHDLVTTGRSLYKIANLGTMKLKVYVSGDQLSALRLGDSVKVYIDKGKAALLEMPGVISWISSEVEFTPKIIQTREERVNMVYAVKILVKNDGSIKIGMPGEVRFYLN